MGTIFCRVYLLYVVNPDDCFTKGNVRSGRVWSCSSEEPQPFQATSPVAPRADHIVRVAPSARRRLKEVAYCGSRANAPKW